MPVRVFPSAPLLEPGAAASLQACAEEISQGKDSSGERKEFLDGRLKDEKAKRTL